MVNDCAAEVASSELGLGHADASVLVVDSHAHFRFHDLGQNLTEGLLQGVRLLLEQVVALFGAYSSLLVDLEGHARRQHTVLGHL